MWIESKTAHVAVSGWIALACLMTLRQDDEVDLDKVRELTDELVLDVASGLEIVSQVQSFPSDLVSTNINTVVYRKFLRIEFLIN